MLIALYFSSLSHPHRQPCYFTCANAIQSLNHLYWIIRSVCLCRHVLLAPPPPNRLPSPFSFTVLLRRRGRATPCIRILKLLQPVPALTLAETAVTDLEQILLLVCSGSSAPPPSALQPHSEHFFARIRQSDAGDTDAWCEYAAFLHAHACDPCMCRPGPECRWRAPYFPTAG